MDDISIPKIKKEVVIAFKDGGLIKKHKLTIFLNKLSATRAGEETIIELLNSDKQFVPSFITNGEEVFTIINLESVLYLQELEEIKEDNKEDNKVLSVQFITGEKIKVVAHEDLPEYRSRTVDFLNGDHVFLTFVKDNQKIHINKNKINKVEIL
ncbi:MAG: hypothetical protein PF638_02515 [Candidatus Delongbacteria bacterium]|jgi:hypothetical protein|nr:hypothetical protein [Candidatus Delongbacteria bacterium]